MTMQYQAVGILGLLTGLAAFSAFLSWDNYQACIVAQSLHLLITPIVCNILVPSRQVSVAPLYKQTSKSTKQLVRDRNP